MNCFANAMINACACNLFYSRIDTAWVSIWKAGEDGLERLEAKEQDEFSGMKKKKEEGGQWDEEGVVIGYYR